ncbi:MAG TPA: glycosyltransferase [Solirubrobacteraceae bacterium]|nr:glycosyltransferase [Solirubrobacteraceae bacterium]
MSSEPKRGRVATLWRRIVLTWRYQGPLTVLFRILTFPLRFTPLRDRLGVRRLIDPTTYQARRWYRAVGEPVTVVIPSYRDADEVRALVRSIRATTPDGRVRIIVADDASGPEHVAALRRIDGIEIVEGDRNVGFAANLNRGLRAAGTERDVVVLNSDVVARRDWLAALQYSSREADYIGIVGGKLLYPDGRIQFAGTVRNLGAREWFDHRYRFRAADFGPSRVAQPVLAVTGACMYLRRELVEAIGLFDEDYPMAYEDVDYCLRCWQAGRRVTYAPTAVLTHKESVTRGTNQGGRELASQRLFWTRWGEFLDARPVRTPDDRLRVIYVTEDTGVGGGHRDIFEHLNRLAARGHDVSLYSLAGAPKWFDLAVPVRSFRDYGDLMDALAPLDAIKVATWWNTAAPVWLSSTLHGIPVYFVQDIETSYYPDDEDVRNSVLASYRHEFRYMTISSWNRDRLRELGLDAELIPPGINLENFRPLAAVERRRDMLLALGRTNPLKNLPLTLDAWRALGDGRPELRLFGIEPEIADGRAGIVYEERPSDERVNELMCEATVFVQTSTHEGFCLPALEAMATGAAVVCTDAHGNRDFCEDGVNCLLPAARVEDVRAALERVLTDPALCERLGAAGIATAADYAWERRIDALEAFLEDVAAPHLVDLEMIAAAEAAAITDSLRSEAPPG